MSLQDALIERFQLQARYDTSTRADTRKELSDKTRAVSGKDGLISVEVDDTDPQLAAQIANAYVEELHNLLGTLKSGKSTHSKETK